MLRLTSAHGHAGNMSARTLLIEHADWMLSLLHVIDLLVEDQCLLRASLHEFPFLS